MTVLPLTRDPRSTRPVLRRPATPEEVADAELRGAWVVDARRRRTTDRAGWLIEADDDIVFLTDTPDSEPDWPPVWERPDGAA